MDNQHDDEVFECFLKAAVTQSCLKELELYPSDEGLEKIKISVSCDCRIRRMIKKYWIKRRIINGLKITRKIASLLAIILGLSFISLLQFKEVRAACYNIYIQFTEKFVQFNYKNPGKLKPIEVNYIPKGYYEEKNENTRNKYTLLYKNSNGNSIIISYFESGDIMIDNEHYNITDIKINGAKGEYFSSKDGKFRNYLMWYGDKGYFTISATLNEEVLLKIAEKIA